MENANFQVVPEFIIKYWGNEEGHCREIYSGFLYGKNRERRNVNAESEQKEIYPVSRRCRDLQHELKEISGLCKGRRCDI